MGFLGGASTCASAKSDFFGCNKKVFGQLHSFLFSRQVAQRDYLMYLIALFMRKRNELTSRAPRVSVGSPVIRSRGNWWFDHVQRTCSLVWQPDHTKQVQ